MQVDVFNMEQQPVGKIELPDDVFAVEVNETLLWEQVRAQRASWRRGTHETLTRGEVRGGAKPYKQKGTGRARQGSSRAPNHVGGGVVFGPHNRDYSYRLPRTARRAALRCALSVRAAEQAIVVIDAIAMAAPRTKAVAALLTRLQSPSALLVDVDNDVLLRATRNLPRAKCLTAGALNVYDILDHSKLVLTRAAVEHIVSKAQPTRTPTAAAA